MPVVELEPDVYDFLRTKILDFNETVSAVLRRELNLPKPDAATSPAVEASLPIDAPTPLVEFIAGMRRQYRRTATAKFLAVLGFIHQRDPKAFEKVLEIGGRSRKYFARSRQEITSSGTSTHPKQIQGSGYWVMTNADTGQKRDMLRQVLKTIGYSADDIRAASDAF